MVRIPRATFEAATAKLKECVKRLASSQAPQSRELSRSAEAVLYSLIAAIAVFDCQVDLWGDEGIRPIDEELIRPTEAVALRPALTLAAEEVSEEEGEP